jgi:hypothetical protein
MTDEIYAARIVSVVQSWFHDAIWHRQHEIEPAPGLQQRQFDGPLITGNDAQSGFVPGRPNYVIIYGEGCFNSKRQAQRTVELYGKYRSSIHFVAIDLDVALSAEQQELVKEYYKGYIPHVLVLDGHGKALYNQSGEVESTRIESVFKNALHP